MRVIGGIGAIRVIGSIRGIRVIGGIGGIRNYTIFGGSMLSSSNTILSLAVTGCHFPSVISISRANGGH